MMMMNFYGGRRRTCWTPAPEGVDSTTITGKTIIGNVVDAECSPGAWPPRAGRFRALRPHW